MAREFVIKACKLQAKGIVAGVPPRSEMRHLMPPPAWSFNHWRSKYASKRIRDRKEAVEGIMEATGADRELAERMLKGEIPYKVSMDEDLVFTVE